MKNKNSIFLIQLCCTNAKTRRLYMLYFACCCFLNLTKPESSQHHLFSLNIYYLAPGPSRPLDNLTCSRKKTQV